MPRVVHFEIAANDPERMIAFYRDVFDWEISDWDTSDEGYWLITTGPEGNAGINGALFRPRERFTGTVNIVEVPDLREYLDRAEASGGEVVTEVITIPGIGYSAYIRDIEGTLVGLMQPDSDAQPEAAL